jgi:L,D-peptidoglycan transpeptidase YkuD (ErfK/YbiS/YcfS/YnhG family)
MLAPLVLTLALACAPTQAQRLLPRGPRRQLVTVTAPSAAATTATLQLWTRAAGGCWHGAGGPWRARIGAAGVSAHRHEGDGTTPLGIFPIGATMYGVGPDPGVRFRYHRLVCGDWWDGDPSSPTYNRFRHVACGTEPPFGGNSEALWKQRIAYRYFAVIGFNNSPVAPGRGSAIFLHADTGNPTTGCVSLPLPQLVHVLRWLDPAARPRIAIRVAA